LTPTETNTIRRLALGGDPAAAHSLWRDLLAASGSGDPALVLLGAELSRAFGRCADAFTQLTELPTAEERELVLPDLLPQGADLAQQLGGDGWLREVHGQLRRYGQIRAAEQLRHGSGPSQLLNEPPVVRTLHHVACSGPAARFPTRCAAN
jgi:hypothetical protein